MSVRIPLVTVDPSITLSHHELNASKAQDECGIFGVYAHPEASHISYYGLHALQHRGQESAGICASDGARFAFHRGMGLVKEAFDNERLNAMHGNHAIGHVRYSTSGESHLQNAQPLIFRFHGGELAIATNGNLTNAPQLRAQLEAQGSIFQTTSDTEVIAHLIARSGQVDVEGAVREALGRIEGAYALLVMTNEQLIAINDPNGLRPFSMGRFGGAYLFASETCAFDAVGGRYCRKVAPGEMIVIDAAGCRSERFTRTSRRALCSMEYIYFSRPDSDLEGINVHSARKRLGKVLAKEHGVAADVVTGVPDSSISAAIGYAEAAGIPYELGLIKNRYIGRTFIQPSQALREQGVKMKLSAVRKVIEGKRTVLIDDSIVRGTTMRRIVGLLREAGAQEVHVRISSPPFKNPCFYGIDTPSRDELAARHTVEQIREMIGADSLRFLSKRGLFEAVGRPGHNSGLCTACFDADYPVATYEDQQERRLERVG